MALDLLAQAVERITLGYVAHPPSVWEPREYHRRGARGGRRRLHRGRDPLSAPDAWVNGVSRLIALDVTSREA